MKYYDILAALVIQLFQLFCLCHRFILNIDITMFTFFTEAQHALHLVDTGSWKEGSAVLIQMIAFKARPFSHSISFFQRFITNSHHAFSSHECIINVKYLTVQIFTKAWQHIWKYCLTCEVTIHCTTDTSSRL